MPLRQSNIEWNARYHSINSDDDSGFKKPMGTSSCNRHLGGGQNSAFMSDSSTHPSSSSLAGLGALATAPSSSQSSLSSHPHQHHNHHSSSSSSYHDYYQGTSSGSGNTSPTAQAACMDDTRSSEAVLRALLRNEMLKDRIDDVKTQVQTSEEVIATFSLGPVVSAFPQPTQESGTRGIIPQLERNAYGGSVDTVFPVVANEGIIDVTR